MKHSFFTKRFLVILGAILFVLISYGCIYFYYHIHIKLGVTSTVSGLGAVRETFFKFRATHRRWPRTMEEIYGVKISDGGAITEKHCKDYISGLPFRCVTKKNLYHKIGKEKPYRVLVMLPRPYRTELWPFGEIKTIMATYSGINIISPSDSKIIDLSQNAAQVPVVGGGE